MNKNPLTNRSTEASQRSYPFINVSGEKIPPFAAMQVVGDPKNWKAFSADPRNDEVDISFKKIESIAVTNQFDNGLQLWCDKPSAVSELFQDPSILAFNGDSEVGIGGGGRCFYGEYPTRAMIRGVPSFTYSYAPMSGSWHLHPKYGRYGAFRAFCDTQQTVSVSVDGQSLGMRVANITTHDNTKWRPAITGGFTVAGNEQSNLRVATGFYELNNNGETLADGLAYGRNPTLTMRVNTAYLFSMQASFKVMNPPPGLNVIPVQFGIYPFEEKDLAKYRSEYYPYESTNDPSPYETWYLQRFKRKDNVVSPLGVNEALESGTEVRWSRLRLSYVDRIFVKKAPARISVKQTSSPYCEGGGYVGSQMEYDRTGLDIYDRVFNGFPISYSYYGYYGYGNYLGVEQGFALPEFSSDFVSLPSQRQSAFLYFDTSDPWQAV